MAGADYYSCDICNSKTFYDAELDYQRIEGGGFFPAGVGQMKVICCECAESHEIYIIPKGVQGHGTG